MANPTTNFGWVMPTATDLVTSLPADFDVFGQGVDTSLVDLLGGTTGQVLAKASGTNLDFVWSADAAGMVNPMTTTADIIYSSSGSTPARLGIGATADVLTVAGGVPTWAAPAGGADDYTLINAGGTALTGATAITISGISDMNSLYIFTEGDTKAGATAAFSLTFNGDTGSNYSYNGIKVTLPSTVAVQGVQNTSQIALGQNNSVNGYYGLQMKVDGTNATGIKPFEFKSYNGITGAFLYNGTGRYKGTSAISSVTITSSSGNFTGGTIYVFGA